MESISDRKTVLITGCSLGGIGDALAQSFHRKGLRVFATARDLSRVQHLKEMGIIILPLDIVDTSSIKRAVESIEESTGRTLDILVNNAGIGEIRQSVDRTSLITNLGYSSPILDADLNYARKAMEVNLFSRVAIRQFFAPLLLRSKGIIVNIGSIAGVYPSVWQGMYSASCAAENHWSDILRMEMEPFGVKVILVSISCFKNNSLTYGR